MPRIDVVNECPVASSFRVDQVAGLFDVPVSEKSRVAFSVNLPDADETWEIGAIVGPSGSGKSSVIRAALADDLYTPGRWPKDKAVVDAIAPAAASIKEITATLTAVGFSSPPNWVRPYHVLSNGEKFRCDLARALLADRPRIVFDEFTSVVDRTVAKIGSAAISKAVRHRAGRQFVAVTCHYDVLEWLEPDWVLDMATRELMRRRLRRPPITLELHPAQRSLWALFSPVHYLSSSLASAAQCFVATWDGQPCAFVAVCSHFGKQLAGAPPLRMIHRLVVLPDFQGVGVGRHALHLVAQHLVGQGKRVRITTGHPAMIAMLRRAKEWRIDKVSRAGNQARQADRRKAGKYADERITTFRGSAGRAVVSAEFFPMP